MADHIPDPGKHRTLFYDHYANRVRGDPRRGGAGRGEGGGGASPEAPLYRELGAPIAKVFHADPLTCRKCGGKLEIVAYLHDTVAIKQVLDHLGLSPPEESEPPPAMPEVVRVPVDDEGREMEAP